ncbi:HAD-IA family hydrolase [Sanguibacter sp. A247]|uniref:HAD-IA family hydrolase n=1 Tax=unclassified Sanguibacter TaxID=2645534 RepID=UPI003FD897EC
MTEPVVLRAVAVLCDMDGTLVDSTAAVVRAWTGFSEAHGLDPAEVLAYCHGRLTHDTVDVFLPHLPAAERTRLADGLLAGESDRHDGVVEIPGAAAFIARLVELGVPVALVTSAPRDLAVARMGVSGVAVPLVTVTSDDVTDGKPHPEPYLRGAELLGVPIEQCLVLEDADAGITSALVAGARVLVVGAHESSTTEGLPRALDLTDVTVRRDSGDVVLEIGHDGLAAVLGTRGPEAGF